MWNFIVGTSPPDVVLFDSSVSMLLLIAGAVKVSRGIQVPRRVSGPLFPKDFVSEVAEYNTTSFGYSVILRGSMATGASCPFPSGEILDYIYVMGSSSVVDVFSFVRVPP